MTAPVQFQTSWRKSSYSGNDSNCVEVAYGEAVVGLRDSKNPKGGHITVSKNSFRAFLDALKAGDFSGR